MRVHRLWRTPEPFRLLGDCAALILIEEGDHAEDSLKRELRASNSLLRSLIAWLLLFEVRKRRRKRGHPAAATLPAANDREPISG